MASDSVKKIFEESGAIITGSHFVYAKKAEGWFHGPDYVNKDAIYLNPDYVSVLCAEIVKFFQEERIDVIVGPTVGAVSLSQWTTHWMKKVSGKKHVVSVFADEINVIEKNSLEIDATRLREIKSIDFQACGNVSVIALSRETILINYDKKIGTKRILKRGYDLVVRGKNCLVVEDIINSGATVIKTCEEITGAGGRIVGVGALCNRSGGKVNASTLEVPKLFSLLNLEMVMHPEDECPLCKYNGTKSIRTDLGKGSEFFTRKKAA